MANYEVPQALNQTAEPSGWLVNLPGIHVLMIEENEQSN